MPMDVDDANTSERFPEDTHYLKRELYQLVRDDASIFDFLQNGSLDGLWYWDLEDPEHEWLSPRFWEVFGFDPKEHPHRSDAWQHLIYPEDLKVTLENFNKHCEDPSHAYDQVVRYRHKSGSTVWVRCRGIAIRDESGKPIRMLGAHSELTALMEVEQALQEAHDELEHRVERRTEELIAANRMLREEIVERKRVEADLARATEQYKLVTDAIPALIAYVDPQKRYQFTNKSYEDWFGLAPEELRGKKVSEVLGDETFNAVSDHIDGALSGNPRMVETQIRHRDGTLRVVESRYVPHLEPSGAVIGYFVLAIDITERRQAEQERSSIDRKMQEAQKLESLGLMAGGISHDFNNLLTGILGNASICRMELPKDTPAIRYLEEIETTSRHAADLCHQLLAYSGRGRFVIESLDLTKLINDMTHLLQLSVSKSVALRFDLADDLPAVRADASQMRQVVLNLVINASEAIGDDSGMLAVRTGEITADERYLADFFTDHRPAGDYVYLEVSDDGVGMDKASVAKIFDPFFTTKFTGRGLGLAAVMGIVRGHDEGILRARKRQYVQDAASVQRQSAHGRGFVDDGNRDQARSGWNYPGCRR
jgi:PAS domain S-box-containing protein